MVRKRLLARLRQRLREFRTACGANVTITFALAMIPIIGAVGAAVDYSHVNSARTAMQNAVDSTALMLSKDIAALTQAQITTKANSYFAALYTHPEVTDVSVTPNYTTEGGTQIVIQASGTVKASFVSLIGVTSIQIGASSTVKWGNTRLRVALVLDNTGSMKDDSKMTALKTATKNLLTQMKSAAVSNGDVYVSIIPFVKDVNAGAGNYNATWIDWTDWDANNGTCSKSGSNSQSSCTSTGTCSLSGYNSQNSCASAGTCSLSGHNSKSGCEAAGVCSNSNYSWKTSCTNNGYTWTAGVWTLANATWTPATWTPKNHDTWNGCITDRGNSGAPSAGNYDTNVVPPSVGNTDTQFPAEQYGSCPQAVMGLNYDWPTMNTLVDNMSPAGNTNQAIGLAWGWLSIAGGGPFTVPAMEANYKYSQVIILMSDGLNTQDRWYNSASSIDARQKITCDNVKAAGITLYAIHVNTDGDPLSTLLKNCASSSDKFWMLTSANQLVSTFNQIGTQLSNLRVAK